MKKRKVLIMNFRKLLFAFFLISFSCTTGNLDLVSENFQLATEQYNAALTLNTNPSEIPRSSNADGTLRKVGPSNWTSGFFAGVLWYLHEFTGEAHWREEAEKWTEALADIQYFTGHHDVGFMLYCSYGNGLRIAGNNDYRQVLLNGAKSLSSRYNPIVGCIKSWDYRKSWDGKTEWFFPVIIDNMMNLELLFWATRESGDSSFYKIAIQHARTTMKHHFRSDYSSYHVVDYDSLTGEVLDKATCQGFSDESSWARGQAWGLYGYTMTYRESGLAEFLSMAQHIADYMLTVPTLPEDGVPWWDYHVNQSGYTPEWDYHPEQFPEILRDVSAATITASALMELSTYSDDGQKYRDYAEKILKSLSSPRYRAKAGENNHFILKHSVGSIPHSGDVDTPIIYADYYFLEALLRKQKLDKGLPMFAEKGR